MLVETGKKIFCLSLDTGKQSGTFRPLIGHLLSSEGVKPDPKKIAAIVNMEP